MECWGGGQFLQFDFWISRRMAEAVMLRLLTRSL